MELLGSINAILSKGGVASLSMGNVFCSFPGKFIEFIDSNRRIFAKFM